MSIDYTIVIPHRNEIDPITKVDYLQNTIDSILNTAEPSEIIPVEDANGDGTSPTRHRGMVKAKTEVVITCDAHMTFEEGALDRLAQLVAENPLTVGCLGCCTNSAAEISNDVYRGADLYETSENHPFDAKWRKAPNNQPGEIACVMGACYALSQTLYAKIGRPWRIGRGWGCDEQLISIPARLVGGNVVVTSDRCGHLCRSDKDVSFRRTPEEFARTWYTRAALLDYLNPDNLPMLYRILMEQAGCSDIPTGADVADARKILTANQTVAFCDYRRRWMICGEQLQAVTPVTTTTPRPTRGRPMRVATCPVADDYGIECPLCHTVSDRHRIANRYDNGTLRRICVSCDRPFVSRLVD